MLLKKRGIILVILIAVALNAFTFCLAFPEAFQLPQSATFARDFSAYYIGAWRLFHNPTQIYYGGVEPGDYQILPRPQTFKYAPSFLILFAPFLTLSYQNALAAFDMLQLALIPALAFFVYELVKDKNLVLGSIAAVIVLIDPLPSPSVSHSALSFLHTRVASLNAQSFSPSYYSGYMLGNAHVLQTVLLVGALYFGFARKPWLSALLLAFGSFDPRGALIALPLLLWYNRHLIVKFATGAAAFLAATNLPFFFYYGIGFTFLRAEVSGNIVSQMYPYDWIPIYSIAALTIIEIITVVLNQGIRFSFPSTRKAKNFERTQDQ
jgi:hypothetical protein